MSVRLSDCPTVYPYAGLGVTSTSSCSRGSSSLCVSHICLVWDLQQLRRMTMTEVCACKKLVVSGGRGWGGRVWGQECSVGCHNMQFSSLARRPFAC